MLHLNTIDPTIHEILIKLSSAEYLNHFALAGGTALALQLGHRKSIDIDLFAFEKVNMHEVSLFLENDFENISIRRTSSVFIFCHIDSVKSDFVNHSTYKLIRPCFLDGGVRLYSIEDIAAMKLNAVCGRGSKKDFYDIYSLLQIFSLPELLKLYDLKFQSDNSWMALKSIQYFEDAENQEEPELLHSFPTWENIKQFLINTVNKYDLNA